MSARHNLSRNTEEIQNRASGNNFSNTKKETIALIRSRQIKDIHGKAVSSLPFVYMTRNNKTETYGSAQVVNQTINT